MIHIRTDNEELNSKSRFACGIAYPLPEGDMYFFAGESASHRADCLECNPYYKPLGTPVSKISGVPGEKGYSEFKRIAQSWGYN